MRKIENPSKSKYSRYGLLVLTLFFRRAFEKTLRHSWTLLISITLFLIWSIQGFPLLKYDLSSTELLDNSLLSSQDLHQLKYDFEIKPTAFMLIESSPGSSFSTQDLCKLQETLSESIQKQRIASLFSAFDLRTIYLDKDVLSFPKILSPCTEKSTDTLDILKSTPWHGLLTNNSSTDLIGVVSFNLLDPPGKYGQADISAFQDFKKFAQENIQHTIHWTGEMAFSEYFLMGIKRTQILNLFALILIVIFFRAIYGTWKSGFLFTLTIIATNIIIHGLIGKSGHHINPLSSGIFLLILISSIEDFIFVSLYFYRIPSANWRLAFKRILVPSFFTSLTTSVGFASLCVSDLSAIRSFGIWTSLGAMIEWLMIFFVLPALINKISFFQSWVRKERVPIFIKNAQILTYLPSKKVLYMLLFSIPAALALTTQIRLNYSPLEMFSSGHPLRQSIEFFKKTHGWISDVSVVFPHYESKEENIKIIQQLKTLPQVGSIESPYELLNFLYIPNEDSTNQMIESEALHSKWLKQIFSDTNSTRAILYLKEVDLNSINNLKASVDKICQNRQRCYLVGDLVAFTDFSKQILHTLFESLITCLFLVGGIIFVLAWARRNRDGWILIISSFWGPILLLGLIAITQVSINLVTCSALSIVTGLTGDNAIQFLFSSKKTNSGIQKMGIGSIHCSLIMSLGSLVFLGSMFQPVKHLGLLLSGAFLLALLGDIWLLKGLLSRKNTR